MGTQITVDAMEYIRGEKAEVERRLAELILALELKVGMRVSYMNIVHTKDPNSGRQLCDSVSLTLQLES